MRLSKPWLHRDDVLEQLHGNLGVFQLGDADGKVVFIGYAGGQSPFGLKGVVGEALAEHAGVTQVRYEVTTAYHTRYRELLMLHVADHHALPPLNPESDMTLGRLSPN